MGRRGRELGEELLVEDARRLERLALASLPAPMSTSAAELREAALRTELAERNDQIKELSYFVGRLERKGSGKTHCLQIMQRIRRKGKPRGLAAADAMMVGTSWFFTCP